MNHPVANRSLTPGQTRRRLALVSIATILSLLLSMFPQVAGLPMPAASAHNLQTRMVYMFMDPATQQMLDDRMAAPSWTPPDPLLQAGDELGIIIKVIPRDGTTTGVGGHVDFYVPNGLQVMDAAYLVPDGTGGYLQTAMKGQSPIAIGAGPIGAKATTQLIGWGALLDSPNGILNDVAPVVSATGLHRGTIAGVYGDTGIFYSTDPDTAYGSWQTFTGDSVGACGSLAYNPSVTGKTLVNNSGDTVVPCNKWDAEQLMAWSAKGGTFGATAPIVDYADGRGNAPWGFASGVAGPQSGYAWMFDWDEWNGSGKAATDMQNAMDTMGPWQRLQYPGSRISLDQPGLISSVLGYASVDASHLGVAVSTLPATVSQTDATSPKVIRWAVGQLTSFRPEYVWVKVKVNSAAEITNATGCPVFKGDTFGGDAGGTDNGKDHLWRYYEPTETTWNGCLAVGKPATREFVKVGDTFQYKIKVYNLQNFAVTNVKVTDTLPSGVTFVSAVPAQNTGPNPLFWNAGTLLPGQKFEATVTVKASGTGYLDNSVTVTSDQLPPQTITETTVSGAYPYLVPTKSVTPTAVAPGATVEYTILVSNVGTGATGTPVLVEEFLPAGFTYDPTFTPVVTVNGANITTTTVNATNPSAPTFSVPAAINGGSQLTIKFKVKVASTAAAGEYCNTYRVTQNGVPITTGSEACVTVAGGQIGDTVWRDWDGDGMQDAGEEGLSGIPVNLYASDGTTLLGTTTTDVNGYYLFAGLVPGTYVVKVNDGTTPAGYSPTGDPDATLDNMHTVTLALNQQYLTADFGYQPTGTASIGDLVFEDKGSDGSYDSGLGDLPISGITVNLYEDTNGNGVIDAGVDAFVATTTTDVNGIYGFPNLATGFDYIVDVDQTGIDAYFATTGWALTTPAEPYHVDNLSGAYLTADFGYYKLVPGALGDQVFIDENGNGTYEAGTDQPLADITVSLYRDTNANGILDAGEPLLQTDVSDSLGVYGFENIPAGDYIVVVDSADPDVPGGLYPIKGQYATNLTSGETDNTLDFPFAQLVQKSVTPTVAAPGDTLNYTINVNYPGATALQNVVMTDTVPAGTTFVSANAGGTLSVDGKTITWDLGSGDAGHPGVTSPEGTAICYATKTYVAAADTYVSIGAPTINYGTTTEFFTRPANATSIKHSLLYFDLAADPLPPSADIIKADLSLYVTSARAGHIDELHRMLTPWTEGTVSGLVDVNGASWNDSDGTSGPGDWAAGTFSISDYHPGVLGNIVPATTGFKIVNITNVVKDWALNGVPNYGFALISTGTDDRDIKYASAENTTTANRPTLVVGYYYESTTTCSGTDVVLPSVADTYIQKDKQTTTAGTATTMFINPANNDTGTATNHSLVRFDLASIPPGATISSATLKPTVTTARTNNTTSVHRMITPWTELGASWGDSNGATAGDWAAGIFGSGDYSATSLGTITNTPTGQKSVVVTGAVNDWVNNGVANQGFLLRATGTDNGDAKYATREDATVARRPVLTVSWSATPSTNPQTFTTLKAEPLYRNGAGQVKVTMTVAVASGTITGVTPPATLDVNANGPTVTLSSGPTPAGPVDITSTSPATFVYVYDVTPGALPGTVRWTGLPSQPTGTFATALSETIIVAPPLTFQATVDMGTTLGSVKNLATFSSRESGEKVSPDLCYLVADGSDGSTVDQLASMDPSTGDYVDISKDNTPTGTGTYNVEGLTWTPDGTKLLAVENGNLVSLDPGSGLYTIIGPVGAIQGSIGGTPTTIWTPDVDSLAFDPATGILYAVARREDSPITNGNLLLDVLFQINPATGLRVANAFGSGLDYVTINTASLATSLYDIDGITFDPASGVLYGIANDPIANIGLGDRLVIINKTTGAVTDIGPFAQVLESGTTIITDMEGLSYLAGVGIIGTTGDSIAATGERNALWVMQPLAVAGQVEVELITDIPASTYIDWEAVACKVGPTELGAYIVPPTDSNQAVTALKASIGDFVWADLDGAGDQDAGEPGLAGVTVKLYDSTGTTLLATTITDATGAYHFYDLDAGTYKVTYDLSSAPADYQPTTAPMLTVTVATSDQYTAADFGLEPPGTASIGDTVWLDANENGLLDVDEDGLAGVTVRLYVDLDDDGVLDPTDVLVEATVTDADGLYQFTGLQDGKYLVQVDTSSPVTSPYDGTTTIAASMDLVSGANPKPVTLAVGQSYTDADFGYNWGGSIGDLVWWDDNRNGIRDGGEAAIPNAAVLLYYDADNDGILNPVAGDYQIGFAMTDANGAYLLDNLPPGNYLVDVYEDSITTDGVRNIVPTTADVREVDLAANQDITWADFGYFVGAQVQGNVYWDEDRNQIFDEAETGLTPVTVTLTGTDMFGNPVTATTTTDADGHFRFIVPEGNYTLTYDTAQTTAMGYPEATTPTSFDFHAYPGEDWHPTFDFGVDNAGKVGDLVWNDADGDGVHDPVEPGIGGVTVTLYQDTNNDGIYSIGDKFMAATATDPNGAYLFTGLADGTYFAIVDPTTVPTGYTQTGDPELNNDNRGTAVVSSGGSVLTMDFGYKPPATAHVVSGTVWNDDDGNGVITGGEGLIPNATVCLYDSTGTVELTCTTTDTNGYYVFPGVADGSYIVKVDPTTLPSLAFTPTYDPTMPLDNQTPVTVSGADVTNQNFGYREILGSISGTVCEGDGDGLCEPGESGLTPVTVTLIWAGPDGIMGTTDDVSMPTTTDANGNYSFPDLVPGLYQIIETNPLNYVSLADADGGNPDSISLYLPLGLVLNDMDFEDELVDIGYIGDKVWWDIDNDGIQDAGEPGIPGVTVELYKSGNPTTPYKTMTTDATGKYEFTALAADDYIVRIKSTEFDPGGTLENWAASPVDQTTDDLDSDGHPTTHDSAVTIGAGQGTADVDFGFSITSSYTVTKALTSLNPSRLGDEITFSITIVNTGDTWITTLPLQDTYNNAYLTYGFGGTFATPDTVDHVNDGVLDWTDLTAAAPYGFGADIAPGETKVVQISFTARADTSALPGSEVVNSVTVTDAVADPDGPAGPLPPLAPLTPQTGEAPVSIYTPTGLVLEWFDAAMTDGAMLVNWRTASEAEVIGFNVLRRAEAEATFASANAELILAQFAGQESGGVYTLQDAGLASGTYIYRLEGIRLDGSADVFGEVTVTVP